MPYISISQRKKLVEKERPINTFNLGFDDLGLGDFQAETKQTTPSFVPRIEEPVLRGELIRTAPPIQKIVKQVEEERFKVEKEFAESIRRNPFLGGLALEAGITAEDMIREKDRLAEFGILIPLIVIAEQAIPTSGLAVKFFPSIAKASKNIGKTSKVDDVIKELKPIIKTSNKNLRAIAEPLAKETNVGLIERTLKKLIKPKEVIKEKTKYIPIAKREKIIKIGEEIKPKEIIKELPTKPSIKPIIAKRLEPLAEEARKFKTADEFARADFQKRVIAGQDLGEEISKKVNPDGTITLFHGTSKKNIENINKTKTFNKETFFSVKKIGTEFGDSPLDVAKRKFGKDADVLEIKVDARELESAAAGSEVFSPKRLTKGKDGVWRAENIPENLTDIFNQAKKVEVPEISIKEIPEIKPITKEGLDFKSPEARESKIVPAEKVKEPLSKDVYIANRNIKKGKGIELQAIKDSFNKWTSEKLVPISTRLKNIDISLKRELRKFEFKVGTLITKELRRTEPFLNKVKKMNKEDMLDFDLARKNGDGNKIDELVKKYKIEKEYNTLRKTLDDIHARAKDVGFDIGYEKNYNPRQVKDTKGFLEHFQKSDDWSIIDDAIKTKEIELGRYLADEEKVSIINVMIRGYKQGQITLSKTGAMKSRTIDIVDGELNQFYHSSDSSLVNYINTVNERIEARRFFGKEIKAEQIGINQIDDSIGGYILKLLNDGKIKPSQEQELREILLARFAPKGLNSFWGAVRNIEYIDTMGSPISALTQIQDLGFSLYKAGYWQTVKAFGTTVFKKQRITREDLGIEKIAQEFADPSFARDAVTKVFKLIGLEKIDAIGKETLVNAVVGRYSKLAKAPDEKFLKKLEDTFGDQKIIDEVINDLKHNIVTENIKILAFNDLADIQPILLSEMPVGYLTGGNGRIFYMLKTYQLKLFDIYRNEVIQVIKRDPVEGLKNLARLTSALVVMGVTADEIKDFVLGRKTSIADRAVDNILKLTGFSKWALYKARQEGIGSAVLKQILPPAKIVDALYKDGRTIIKGEVEEKRLETITSIPFGGKLYYWWFGKGRLKTEKKEKKGIQIPSINIPSIKIPSVNIPSISIPSISI